MLAILNSSCRGWTFPSVSVLLLIGKSYIGHGEIIPTMQSSPCISGEYKASSFIIVGIVPP